VQVEPRPDEAVLVRPLQDLEGELQVRPSPFLVGFISLSVITARYLPAGSGSRSVVGSTSFALKPCSFLGRLVIGTGLDYGLTEVTGKIVRKPPP